MSLSSVGVVVVELRHIRDRWDPAGGSCRMFVLSMLPCVQLTMVPRMVVVVLVVVSSSLLIVPWLKFLLSIHCQNCIMRVHAHDMKMAVLFELQKNDDFAWRQ